MSKKTDLIALGMPWPVVNRLEASYDHLKTINGSISLSTVGQGISIAGTNKRLGTVTLNGTTPVATANTTVTANTRIFLMPIAATNGGTVVVDSVSVGVSFSVVSTNALDTRVVNYVLLEELSGDNTPTTATTPASELKENGLRALGGPVQQANRLVRDYDDFTIVGADLNSSVANFRIGISGGSNSKLGQATLVAGTVTVANTSVTAASRIFLTGIGTTNASVLKVGTVTAGTSFVINSGAGGDTRVINWWIVEGL